MGSQYQYPPDALAMLAVAVACAALAALAWRRRPLPAARALSVLAILGVPWALGAALEVSATDLATRLFWFRFHTVGQLPAATAALWFALEYADRGRWHAPPKLTLFSLVVMVALSLLMLTSDAHHLIWETLGVDRQSRGVASTRAAVALAYGLLVSVATMLVFLWLFLSAPAQRAGAGLCIVGQFISRAAYAVEAAAGTPEFHMDLTVLAFPISVGFYAVALFRFHVFDLLPVARGRIVDQMPEGVVVLNTSEQVLDLNPAAEEMFGISVARARAQRLSQVLPEYPELVPPVESPTLTESELRLGTVGNARYYTVHHSRLVHRQGFTMGWLIVLRDVTRERESQAATVDQQRAYATLQERDRLARELHDSFGQIVGFAKMQGQAARDLLVQGRTAEADSCLRQLVSAAQDAHDDVRDYINAARLGVASESAFLERLRAYLEQYSATFGIEADLYVAPPLCNEWFEPVAAAQLLRIIQEALTNIRKHARARTLRVALTVSDDSRVQAVIQDDGAGFDPALPEAADALKFGLRYMRERAEELGATVCIRSAPGQGTQVTVSFPARRPIYEDLAC